MMVTSRAFINELTQDNPNQVLCECDEPDKRANLTGGEGCRAHRHCAGVGGACRGRTGACQKIAKQIDYLGGMPSVTPKPVKTSSDPVVMLRADLENERETMGRYRERIRQAEAMGEFALSENAVNPARQVGGRQ